MMGKGMKNVIRGIVFIIYFPFHLTHQVFCWLFTYLFYHPLEWIWSKCLSFVGCIEFYDRLDCLFGNMLNMYGPLCGPSSFMLSSYLCVIVFTI